MKAESEERRAESRKKRSANSGLRIERARTLERGSQNKISRASSRTFNPQSSVYSRSGNPQSATRFPLLPALRSPLSALRSGISVLEVLISIGVASVGLLGVILLIPLADHQMNRGLVLERSNQVGANAFREFEIMGADNPGAWKQLTGLAQPVISTTSSPAALQPMGTPLLATGQFALFPTAGGEIRRAFCLDPSFVATNGGTVLASGEDPRFFPYPDPNVVRFQMPRITLQAPVNASFNPLGVLLSQHADLLFTSHDDLEFRRPDADRTLSPVQLSGEGTDWNPNPPATPADTERIRQARGRLSWIATLVPQEKVGPNGDEYILSIVVFHGRDGSFSMVPGPEDSANERVVGIPHDPTTGGYSGFFSSGTGGGDVALMPLLTGLTYDAAKINLDVKAGDWVMLSRRNPYLKGYDNTTSPPTPIYGDAPHTHRWYRVVSADDDIIDSAAVPNAPAPSWIRFVTLDGPDFDPYYAGDYLINIPGINQVTIVKNVAAVFEKTIRLDTSSLWMSP